MSDTNKNIGQTPETPAQNQCGHAVNAMPFDPRLIGKVGVCSIGKVGVIADVKLLPWGMSYVGVNVENGEQWASRAPVILADSLPEFIGRKVRLAWNMGREGRPLHYAA